MNIKAVLILLAALGVYVSGHADVECRVVCSKQDDACLAPVQGLSKTTQGAYKITNCDSGERKTISPASVWYSRNAILVVKSLPGAAVVAAAVTDGDRSCNFLGCLFNSRSGRPIIGANPMGKQTAVQTSPAIIAAGLPFEEIAVPAEGLSINVDAAGTGGTLSLTDEAGKRYGPYSAAAGRVLVPSGVLQSAGAYQYRWTASGVDLQGSFKVARQGTVRRATAAAETAAADNPSPANRKLALAGAYLEAGLQWNARKLLGEVERGE